MAVGPLFLGLLVLLWLTIGMVGWAIASFCYRPNASFLALGAALAGALFGGTLPALLFLRALPGLLLGLLLAAVFSTGAAWQTMRRLTRRRERTP